MTDRAFVVGRASQSARESSTSLRICMDSRIPCRRVRSNKNPEELEKNVEVMILEALGARMRLGVRLGPLIDWPGRLFVGAGPRGADHIERAPGGCAFRWRRR